jgi:hypothetical protein
MTTPAQTPGGKVACHSCGSDRIQEVRCQQPHHARVDCLACGRKGRYLPAPWSLGRAERFSLGFGKFQGQRFDVLVKSEAGRSYLRWLIGQLDPHDNAVTAAMILSGLLDPEEVDRGRST